MARKDSIEVEGTVVEHLPNTCSGWNCPMGIASLPISRGKCACIHSHLARRQSYARSFPYDLSKGRITFRIASAEIGSAFFVS